jgi:hypothetical protein
MRTLWPGVLVLAPRVHDERVVDRQARDLVDALRLELVVVGEVRRHVLGRARRRERAGQPEHDDLLPLEQLVGLERVRSDRAAFLLDLVVFHQRSGGNVVADLDRHGLGSEVAWGDLPRIAVMAG